MERTDKHNYYLDIADAALERATCIRRKFGAAIIKDDAIISTGYCGSPRGRANCCDIGFCAREKLNVPRGQRYELCRSVHAEQNAIIAAGRERTIGATLYLVGRDAKTNELVEDTDCCSMCKRVVINAGIKQVVIRVTNTEYKVINVSDWVENDDSLDLIKVL